MKRTTIPTHTLRAYLGPKLLSFILGAAMLPVLAVSLLAAPFSEPGEAVEATVAEVKAAVKKGEETLAPEQLDEKLRAIIAPVFDFEEMSRRSLGANWRKGTPEQRKEFVDLFSDLLAKNYLRKIRENAAESVIKMVGQKKRGKRALVKTVIIYEDEEADVVYRLRKKPEGWKVYDVVIENIGLVSNYRSEFAGILSRGDFSELLELLRKKSAG